MSNTKIRTVANSKIIAIGGGLLLLLALLLSTMLSPVFSQSREMIPRALLEDMARSQYDVLCASEAFTACMGFSAPVCKDISAQAIDQCLSPLPKEIDPLTLDNSALESCPKQVFADAGFSEEKAEQCFDEAVAQPLSQ